MTKQYPKVLKSTEKYSKLLINTLKYPKVQKVHKRKGGQSGFFHMGDHKSSQNTQNYQTGTQKY